MHRDEPFRKVKNLVELSIMLVQTKKSIKHDIVYSQIGASSSSCNCYYRKSLFFHELCEEQVEE
jgi:hypothetical protein